jgi:hypothetical protein
MPLRSASAAIKPERSDETQAMKKEHLRSLARDLNQALAPLAAQGKVRVSEGALAITVDISASACSRRAKRASTWARFVLLAHRGAGAGRKPTFRSSSKAIPTISASARRNSLPTGNSPRHARPAWCACSSIPAWIRAV